MTALSHKSDKELLEMVKLLHQKHGLDIFNMKWRKDNNSNTLFIYLSRRDYTTEKICEYLNIDFQDLHNDRWQKAAKKLGKTYFNSWEEIVDYVRPLVKDRTQFPTQQWFQKNGHGCVQRGLWKFGKRMNDLAAEFDFGSNFAEYICKAGLRHRSFGEVQVSDFLYKYGATYRSEPQYPDTFSTEKTDSGRFDFEFQGDEGTIYIEVWGGMKGNNDQSDYNKKRKQKEDFCSENKIPLLGIEYNDTLSEDKLETIFSPHLKNVRDKNVVNTITLSFEDRVISKCREIANNQPDGLMPSEHWLRKRDGWGNREGDADNTLPNEIRAIGGITKVRQILGEESQYRNWDDDKILKEIKDFYETYQKTPQAYATQWHRNKRGEHEVAKRAIRVMGAINRSKYSAEEAYRAAGIDEENINIRWDDARIISEVQKFIDTHGKFPNTYYAAWYRRKEGDYEIAKWASRLQSAMRRTKNLRTREAIEPHLNLKHIK